jgi:hypothetical protein
MSSDTNTPTDSVLIAFDGSDRRRWPGSAYTIGTDPGIRYNAECENVTFVYGLRNYA